MCRNDDKKSGRAREYDYTDSREIGWEGNRLGGK